MPAHSAFGLAVEALDILVVEDSRTMQTLVRSMLAGLGIERIRVHETAELAIQSMVAHAPDVIIANWRMEPTSGYQLLLTLRRKSMEPLCFVPFIMVSAQSTRALVEMAFRAGAQDFLAKPIAPSTMHQSLKRLVADQRNFRLDGDAYVIDGVSERLEQLRENEKALERARRFHYADATEEGGARPSSTDAESGEPREMVRPARRSYGAIT